MVFTPKTEGLHPGEFLVQEALPESRYTRKSGTVASAQNLVDGQLVQISGGKLVAKDTNLNTEGEFITPIEGIILGNHNRTTTGPEGAADELQVAYVERGPAVVKQDKLTFPAGSPQLAAAIAELDAKGIKMAEGL